MRKRLLLIGTAAVLGVPILVLACAPRAVTGYAATAFPGCVYEIAPPRPVSRPTIALTIDDAPDRATTPAILDTLRANGAHATFFVITSQLDSVMPDPTLARLQREGHEIGNHLSQERIAVRLDSATFERDLAAADSALRRYGPVRWVRPGSGFYSQRMVRAMHRGGYECALGSVYPFDAGLGWRWLSEWYILAHARPGAIIILHDRGPRGERTAEVLGRVLPALRSRGYAVVTLSELANVSRSGTSR
jgi:peptidoglycan/xylan/chitin deacetylase (PgdA/CDA1 family)